MPPIITLLTDFGMRDAYVASMKGVILSIAPDARIIDITHEVAPQDIVEGAWVLASAYRWFPAGTVHVVVVDPGVGGARRAVAAQAGAWTFVAPDNGLLSWALEETGDASELRAVELRDPRWFQADVSLTFHGRDIFAPVAAHLATGVALDELGPRIDDLVALPVAQPMVTPDSLTCEVVHVDRFGNAITNLDAMTLTSWARGAAVNVIVANHGLGDVRRTYAEVGQGEPLALIESTGRLEIAVRDGSAAAVLGTARGTRVEVVRW
jgi:S-adenosylmethionine hydrolase